MEDQPEQTLRTDADLAVHARHPAGGLVGGVHHRVVEAVPRVEGVSAVEGLELLQTQSGTRSLPELRTVRRADTDGLDERLQVVVVKWMRGHRRLRIVRRRRCGCCGRAARDRHAEVGANLAHTRAPVTGPVNGTQPRGIASLRKDATMFVGVTAGRRGRACCALGHVKLEAHSGSLGRSVMSRTRTATRWTRCDHSQGPSCGRSAPQCKPLLVAKPLGPRWL